jgi:hypothetical protein
MNEILDRGTKALASFGGRDCSNRHGLRTGHNRESMSPPRLHHLYTTAVPAGIIDTVTSTPK